MPGERTLPGLPGGEGDHVEARHVLGHQRTAVRGDVVQDEATSVVFGMPKAAIDRGHAARVLSLDALANTLQAQCGLARPAAASSAVSPTAV